MSVFELSLRGGAVILLAMIIRGIFRSRLPRSVAVILWEISLLNLSLPFRFALPKSRAAAPTAGVFWGESADPAALAQINLPGETAAAVPVLRAIWLAGAAALACYFLAAYAWGLMRCTPAEQAKSPHIDRFLSDHPLKRTVSVRVSEKVSTPLTYGIIRPVILLPKSLNIQTEKQLNCILLHELCHIKRFDGLLKLWANAVLCVHWFNPLVWAMRRLLDRDIELRCDESVLKELGPDSREIYAMTLIGLKEQRSGFSAIGSGFGKSAVQERIEAIMKFKKRSVVTAALAGVLAVSVLSATVFAISRASESRNGSLTRPEQYKMTFPDDDGVSYVRMSPSAEGHVYECDGFTFEGRVIFTDENGEPFSAVIGESDNISLILDNSEATDFTGEMGFISGGEKVKSAMHDPESLPFPCAEWGISHEFDDDAEFSPYLESEETAYVRHATLRLNTASFAVIGGDESRICDTPLEEAAVLTLDMSEEAQFSQGLTANLEAGDRVTVNVDFDDGAEDIRWQLCASKLGDDAFPVDVRTGRKCDCSEIFDISEGGDYIFKIINCSENGITVSSAEITVEKRTKFTETSAENGTDGLTANLAASDFEEYDDFGDVLGFKNCKIKSEETAPHFFTRRFYAEIDGELRCIAEMFDRGEGNAPEAYCRDLDGDGVEELICNCVAGDGWQSVVVYRRSGEGVEMGLLRGEFYDRLGAVNFGPGSSAERYDPATGFEVAYYTEAPSADFEPERKTAGFAAGIENFEFWGYGER